MKPKFVFTSAFRKFSDGNIVDKASVIDVIKTCLSFDFPNFTWYTSESESSNGPVF